MYFGYIVSGEFRFGEQVAGEVYIFVNQRHKFFLGKIECGIDFIFFDKLNNFLELQAEIDFFIFF